MFYFIHEGWKTHVGPKGIRIEKLSRWVPIKAPILFKMTYKKTEDGNMMDTKTGAIYTPGGILIKIPVKNIGKTHG